MDKQDHVFVCDTNNDRIVLLSPELIHLGYIQTPEHQLCSPIVMDLDEFSRRLYVGDISGKLLVCDVNEAWDIKAQEEVTVKPNGDAKVEATEEAKATGESNAKDGDDVKEKVEIGATVKANGKGAAAVKAEEKPNKQLKPRARRCHWSRLMIA